MASGARPGSLVPPRVNGTAFPGLVLPPADDGPRVESCTHVDTHYDIKVAIVFSLYIIFGIVYTFVGYRCFKTVMFLTGFIFASSIVYLICQQGDLMPTYGNEGVSLLAGVLFGLITMLVQYVGLFMSGLHTGVLLGLAGLFTADHFVETSPKGSVWLCVGVLLCSALTVAIFNLYFRKSLTILGSSLYGGATLSIAIDYFVEKLSMVSWLWQRVSLRPVQPPPCWFSWIVLGAWPSFVLAGLIIQFGITGRGIHHEDVKAGRKKSRAAPTRVVTRAERAEMKQKKYRYLYQVRTAHGDVISQNFVQQLQKKENNDSQGECSTLQSDATHLTILPDTQLAALTESEDDSQTEINARR
ncbi:transmembrane protein 198 [Diorhabda carinulata]|uniref:transmembrane protein 198 n=1 Tax=Diorhabda sublineata TaxID=1163346 RepID=UPI0024E06950|nr:transmembrane protein 198 [Diorhabda sublineata]XP_056632424.1 transmembrane protein 198 [Diorhabda sublineata]XP_057665832.1 transmembrane protein 198 [Diorhabda carinulata]